MPYRIYDRLRDLRRIRWSTLIEAALGQLTQKSTIISIGSAAAMLVGWNVAPERLDAIATAISTIDMLALAIIQEAKKVPPAPETARVAVATEGQP
jgi:hypothetical protein